jgi:hypothetical protein
MGAPGRLRARRLPRLLLLIGACLQVLRAQEPPGIAAGPLPAAVVDAIPVTLDAAARQQLMAAGSDSSFFREQPNVDLCPSPAAAADIIRTLNALKPSIGVQTLVVAAMPAQLAANPACGLLLYNLLHQFQSMEGIQYFSASHGRMEVFYTASYLVKGPGDRARRQDPHYPAIEPSHDLYLVQKDSSFGTNLYSLTVKGLDEDAIELTMTNVEGIRYGILPVLGPGSLKLTLVVRPSADGRFLYFYGNAGIKALRLPGLESKVRKSFYNRTLAWYNWFAQMAAHS